MSSFDDGAAEDAARLDIWLWRARFFKKRSDAGAFVSKRGVRVARHGGAPNKVTKPGFRIRAQDVLTFARSGRTICVRVAGLGVRRGPAAEARTLYDEIGADGVVKSSEDGTEMSSWMKGWLERLTGDEDDVDIEDARLSAAALLVEAALADGIYADVEEELIRGIMRTVWSLDDAASAKLLDQAEQIAEQAVDQHRFTRVVKVLPETEREQLVEQLWRVVFADGEESPFEEAFVRRVADLLHVDPRASRLARKRVLDEGGGES